MTPPACVFTARAPLTGHIVASEPLEPTHAAEWPAARLNLHHNLERLPEGKKRAPE